VTVTATSTSVTASNTLQLTATVTGTTQTGVTWSVDGISSGNTTVGTISSSGLYTAPSTTGQHTVTATSNAAPAVTGSLLLTVEAGPPPTSGDITIDFNSRTGGSTIPAGLFGSQLGNLSSTSYFTDPVSSMNTLVSAGMSGVRLYANVQTVFATSTPDWTSIDSTLDMLNSAGMKAILEVTYTPQWLVPTASPGPCDDTYPATHNAHYYNAAPTNNSQYASIAAQYVQHIDAKYPGLVQYYEIWNEADESNSFCGLNSGDSTKDQVRLDEYKALYQATAIAMKAQAATDGVSIMVGGPALGNSNGSSYWVAQLVQLTNNGAQIVDFASYHQYLAGSDVSSTMTWDGTGNTTSLYSRTMSSSTGTAANFQKIAAAAASGPFTVPVMLDEYSDDWDFTNTCCKNTPQYSPVWNTMVFSLIMNSVYSGYPPIQHLSYYAASNQPFCLLGYISSDYTCGAGPSVTPLPYPQFRAYELLASSNYLGLQASGGNMATSIALSDAMNTAKLVATAFYTTGADSIVLVNPSAAAITNASLVVGNHGLNGPSATQYILNASTYSGTTALSGTALTLTTTSTGIEALVTIPAYSVVAIKIAAQ
jgi:hypothetical protein